MTDANLMDADCIHGNVWWECPICDNELGAMLTDIELFEQYDDGVWYEG